MNKFGDVFLLDEDNLEIVNLATGRRSTLTLNQARLLECLINEKGKKNDIIRYIWEDNNIVVTDGSYHQLIFQTRSVLVQVGLRPDLIKTLPRHGLKLVYNNHAETSELLDSINREVINVSDNKELSIITDSERHLSSLERTVEAAPSSDLQPASPREMLPDPQRNNHAETSELLDSINREVINVSDNKELSIITDSERHLSSLERTVEAAPSNDRQPASPREVLPDPQRDISFNLSDVASGRQQTIRPILHSISALGVFIASMILGYILLASIFSALLFDYVTLPFSSYTVEPITVYADNTNELDVKKIIGFINKWEKENIYGNTVTGKNYAVIEDYDFYKYVKLCSSKINKSDSSCQNYILNY